MKIDISEPLKKKLLEENKLINFFDYNQFIESHQDGSKVKYEWNGLTVILRSLNLDNLNEKDIQDSKNIFIQNDSVKVAGFGLARSSPTSPIGFGKHCELQCLKGFCECGKKLDIYKFGIIIGEIFSSEDVIKNSLFRLYDKCLADLNERPKIKSLYEDLKELELASLKTISTPKINIFNISKEFITDKAIYYEKGFGPSFGKTDLSLVTTTDSRAPKWMCQERCYEKLDIKLNVDRDGFFYVDDYE
ncbi:21989_t:CDS:2, partial [Gigaspora rosea]